MKYDYDAVVIGLGPAGMAVSIMGQRWASRSRAHCLLHPVHQ